MTYPQSLAYLDSLVNYEKTSGFDYKKSMKLERMISLSARLGDPYRGIPAIHVAGTKGKGSVSAMINSILTEAGYKVGLYTSPHLFSFKERIKINGAPIEEEQLAELVDKIKPHALDMEKKGMRPTYFEVCTMIAFLYFRLKGVRLMVLEVGMGGRLDSTNIAEGLVSVITPIGYDHTRHLGNTLEDIAYEKCGIIKDNSVVVSSPQKDEAMAVIKEISRKRKSRLYVLGKDIIFEPRASDKEGQAFRLLSRYGEYPRLEIELLGDFQLENAAVAVAAAEELRSEGIFIISDAIKYGLAKTKWPGRLEIIRKRPYVVVDGAQDANSALRLKRAVANIFKYHRLFLVFGVMADKDIDGICEKLYNMADHIIATRPDSERACPPGLVEEKMLQYGGDAVIEKSDTVAEAVDRCMRLAGEDDLILVTGSLYAAAEAMKYLNRDFK